MILIIGCGFLGSYLAKYVSSHTDEKILATIHNKDNHIPLDKVEYIQCDITKASDISVLAEKCGKEPLTVFYFAACHNIDYVYENPEEAKKINIDALQMFLNTMPHIEKLFFASTDCVYGEGKESPDKFNEASPLSPINEYGRQKLSAEKIVLSYGFNILRLPFMLGPSLTTKPHFYDNIHQKLIRGEAIEMIDGMKRSVLSYSQTAELIYSLSVQPDIPEIINVCSDIEMSKYEIGCALAEKLKVSSELIKSISEKEAKKFFKDKRSSCTAMDNSLLKSVLGHKEIVWDKK